MKKWIIVAFWGVAVLVGSCRCPKCPEPDFLLPTPCSPPCWQNITPGETRLNEALQSLKQNPRIYSDTIKVENYELSRASTISWRGHFCVPAGGDIDIEGEIVKRITVSFGCWGFWGVPVAVDDLIKLYGPPLVLVWPIQAKGAWRSFGISLYFPHLGFAVDGKFEGMQGVDSPVPPEILVESVTYVPPGRFEELLPHFLCSTPWDGYREASFYCQCPGVPEFQGLPCEPEPYPYWAPENPY